MSEVTTTLRLPAEMMARIEALIPAVAKRPELAVHGRVSRSTVMRLVILHGLEALEAEAKAGPKKRGR